MNLYVTSMGVRCQPRTVREPFEIPPSTNNEQCTVENVRKFGRTICTNWLETFDDDCQIWPSLTFWARRTRAPIHAVCESQARDESSDIEFLSNVLYTAESPRRHRS